MKKFILVFLMMMIPFICEGRTKTPAKDISVTDVGGYFATDNVEGNLQEIGAVTSGQSNTASNVGSSGTGLFKQKTLVDLEFYKINSLNAYLTIGLDGTDKIDFDIDWSNVLELDNTTSYTPTADYHPATKKYVDNGGAGTPGGITEQIQYNNGGVFAGGLMYYKVATGRVGIGTSTPSEIFSVTGNIAVSGTVDGIDIATDVGANTLKTTNATHTGQVTGSGTLTVDKTALSDQGTVTALGVDYVLISDTSDTNNLKKALISDFASAGGDMVSATYDPANVAEQLVGLTATQSLSNKSFSGNVGIGMISPSQALDVVGKISLNDGGKSVFVGEGAGLNDDGSDNKNVGIGYYSLRSNTTGSYNTANGYASLFLNTTGSSNTANGYLSLYSNTTGSYNFGLGYNAGRYIADGETGNATGTYNTFIGSDTKALADGDTNEIVIGNSAVGVGSNSVVLGNDSITKTVLKGNVGIGTTAPASLLDVADDCIRMKSPDGSYSNCCVSNVDAWSCTAE